MCYFEFTDITKDDEGIDELEEELGDDADEDQGSYQGLDDDGGLKRS